VGRLVGVNRSARSGSPTSRWCPGSWISTPTF